MPPWIKNASKVRRLWWKRWWNKPWTIPLGSKRAPAFKKALWEHGYITPNFTRKEAASRRNNGERVGIPDSLRYNAQYHGCALEKVRHSLGDSPMSPLDWYRDPIHNAEVGGATASQHMQAIATDWSKGRGSQFKSVMKNQFEHGGIGTGGSSGEVMHVDNGPERRWTYSGS